ncbi:MAG: preprotein translocase subunit YajC [Pseudomonadota bacterium]
MSLLVNDVLAATPAATTTGAHNPMYQMILMIVVFVAIFYFLIWRPQSKKMKQQRDMLSSMHIGDEVMCSSGIVGKVTKLRENFVNIEVSKGVEITVQKSAISGILPKGTMNGDVN